MAEICAHRLTTSAVEQPMINKPPMISPQRMLLSSMKELSTSLKGLRGGRGGGSGRGGDGGAAAGLGGGSTVRSTTTDDTEGTTISGIRSVVSVLSVAKSLDIHRKTAA